MFLDKGQGCRQSSDIWSEEEFAWWTKGSKGKKGNYGFQKGGFRSYQPDEGEDKDYSQKKRKRKFHQREGQKEAHPQSGIPATEAPEKDIAMNWNLMTGLPLSGLMSLGLQLLDGTARKAHTAWMEVPSLNPAHLPTHVVLDLGGRRSIGSRSAIERFQKHCEY